jgi:hypothetical protein
MLKSLTGGAAGAQRRHGQRFSCMVAGRSTSTELLQGCPVVTAAGQSIGKVRSLLVDIRSKQLRYVVLAAHDGKASIAIPWHALYFDSALLRLVYYTYR